jgi:hypothetical protein
MPEARVKKPTLFIGSSSEAIDDARALEFLLKEDAEVTLWTHGRAIFSLGSGTLEALVGSLEHFDFAVLLVTPDDVTVSRDVAAASPRDNVVFELGLFIGRLGRERTFVVCKGRSHLKLPSDLAGVTVASYDVDRSDRNMIGALSPTSTAIREGIRSLGFKRYSGSTNDWSFRIAMLGGTTHELQLPGERAAAFKIFYQTLMGELERFPIGINNCGSDPIREIAIDDYGAKLHTHSRSQMEELSGKIRWYWRRGAPRSYNYEPPVYESVEAVNSQERRLLEFRNSDMVLALGGRTGTRSTLEQLLDHHQRGVNGVDLIRTPTILLGWFGGGTKEFIDDNREAISGILENYSELCPCDLVTDWHLGDTPKNLARRLIVGIQRLMPTI